MRCRVVVSSLISLALLGACGSDDESSDNAETTGTAATGTTQPDPTTTTTVLTCDDSAAATTSTVEPGQVVIGCRIDARGDPLERALIGVGTYGPLDGGMTYEQASLAANLPIYVSQFDPEEPPLEAGCTSFGIGDADDQLSGIGGDGTTASLYLNDPDERTDKGVGIGSTRTEVQAAYPTARAVDNLYRDGDDLYVDGTLPGGAAAILRFVFEDDGRASLIITGAATHVGLPEGCA